MIRVELSNRDRRAVTAAGALLAVVAAVPIASRVRLWQADQLALLASGSQASPLTPTSAPVLALLRDSAISRAAALARIDDGLMAGSTPDAIAAKLSAEVGRLADSCGVVVAAVQLRADTKPREAHTAVAVRVMGTADLRGLSAFLGRLDESAAHLSARDIAVTRTAEINPSITRSMPLRFELLVETVGVLRRGAHE